MLFVLYAAVFLRSYCSGQLIYADKGECLNADIFENITENFSRTRFFEIKVIVNSEFKIRL